MADVVNLRQARKQKRRAAEDAAAQQNRARFGQSKAARTLAALAEAQSATLHAGHRRERPRDYTDGQ